MTPTQFTAACKQLKPGDTLDFPGASSGAFRIPTGLAGTKEAPITLAGGGMFSGIPGQATLYAKGLRHVHIVGMHVRGGRDGISLFECQNVSLLDCDVSETANDGLKVSHSSGVQVIGGSYTAGVDQGIDFFAVDGGKIQGARADQAGGVAAIVVKAGSRNVRVVDNTITGQLRVGDPVGEGMGDQLVYDVRVKRNRVRGPGRLIVCSGLQGGVIEGNDLVAESAKSPLLVLRESKIGGVPCRDVTHDVG